MNDVDWKVYTDQRFSDNDKAIQAALVSQEKAVSAALAAAKEAVTKAENAADKRFEAANDVKATFSGQLSEKLGRDEYKTAHEALVEKIDNLTVRVAATEGRNNGLNAGWGYLLGFAGLVSIIIGAIIALRK